MHATLVRVPNAVLLVGDRRSEPPESIGGPTVAVTDAVIAVGTVHAADGATSVSIALRGAKVEVPKHLAFSGYLSLAAGRISVETVERLVIAEANDLPPRVPVEIWTNDTCEPDQVVIVVG